MNTIAGKSARILGVGIMLALVGGAFAAGPAPNQGAEPSKQAREQMAKMHEEMAACLRSEKSFATCQTQMRERCMTTMGNTGCPMMGAGMQHGKPQPPATDKQ